MSVVREMRRAGTIYANLFILWLFIRRQVIDSRGEGDANPKSAADVHATFDSDFPPDGLDEVLDDGESEAGPSLVAGAVAIDAVETFEDSGELVSGDADAGVFDFDDSMAGFRAPAECHGTARVGVFDGVAEKVIEDFLEGFIFGEEDDRFGRRLGVKSDLFALSGLLLPREAGGDDSLEGDGDELELLAVGFAAGEGEHVMNERFESEGALIDHLEESVADLDIVSSAVQECFDTGLNGGERGFQFMRGIGDEFLSDGFEAAEFGDIGDHDDSTG